MIYRDCPLIGTTSPDGGEVGISRNMRPGTLIPPAQVRNPAEKLSLLYCPIFVAMAALAERHITPVAPCKKKRYSVRCVLLEIG